jgi:nucleotide-binding universal stress UspA family protein
MYTHVLVGTDGSKTAAKAVERAVEVAKASNARLTIFSAGPAKRADAVVASAAEQHADAGLDIETKTADREAATALVEEAERGDYDLLVLGNKGLTGARRFLPIGSIPGKVSHHVNTSFLIVRTT